mmetsp:Transcript_63283/g.169196  ORF Transcript_63283/g.169196 Transcript_63283/m.169196 type:complete len:305 (-) Transcript_63283:547-1461(-)
MTNRGGKKVFSMTDLKSAISNDKTTSKPPSSKAESAQQPSLSSGGQAGSKVLDHTVGTVHQAGGGMKRSASSMEFFKEQQTALHRTPGPAVNRQMGREMLVIFDMDHTMVGDLVSLSDRDNIETNVPWVYWPETKDQGLSPDFILPFLTRGMMRPGLTELINHLQALGSTIVVYTHSENKWASKVCSAMERLIGRPFIRRLFSRMDCRDGHPEFGARKSVQYIVDVMRREEGLTWATVEKSIMFDDDGEAVAQSEQSRLVKVWPPCHAQAFVLCSPSYVVLRPRSLVQSALLSPSLFSGEIVSG